ncbi:MAG: MoxR family ATPase [Phaeodactylibacter sp.]|nr:MoxR family ATPase [Phaeodactylibacter sp.]MCB9274026.1 MoxR family ATPase [Lewinellaceae bacterium]
MNQKYRIYKGTGELAAFHEVASINDPEGYLPSDELVNAVNVAITLGKPLLVTGEPGTGKTLLAQSIAQSLHSNGDPLPYLEFTAKTTTQSRDLLYRYDSIGHFHDANIAKVLGEPLRVSKSKSTDKLTDEERLRKEYEPYIHLEPLGKAIQLARDGQQRSVVLIDEVDKAPRDFPNDILREIENMSFKIMETGEVVTADPSYRPIVVITSNSERLLPDAFLRRCVFFHIEFPDKGLLRRIAMSRLEKYLEGTEEKAMRFDSEQLDWLIAHFEEVRSLCRKKQPATAEFLSWLQVLDQYELMLSDTGVRASGLPPEQKNLLLLSYGILAKHKEDLASLRDNLNLSSPDERTPA